ncbi:hypothetical protein BG011_010211 [Mortierella polycephala]|uniref:gamma-glutamylcyclotransferase n=1 Tax=Mortierella polycephala TaxID=41804 RepID=A0A9P6PLW1_9FUNG|nr:hypothetical protein BG011_010211 [Mortierella polycephala]
MSGNNTPETIWYLAYGSNMDPKVFSGRRKIKPLESRVVVAPDYWLSFDINGFPYVEPCFASILKMDRSRFHDIKYAQEIHARTKYGQDFVWDEKHPQHPLRSYPPVLQGVAHKITLRDWQLVIQSEGGWGHDVPTGYNQIQIGCKIMDTDEQISAHVLEARPLSVKSHCQPSARYKNLLTSGAAHHGLDPAYQSYLARVVPYECVGIRPRMARVIFMAVNTPIIFAFAMMFWRNKGKTPDQMTTPPYWIASMFDKASRFSAAVHDCIMEPIFGSGRCSSVEHQIKMREQIALELKDHSKTRTEKQKAREDEVDKAEGVALKVVEKTVESAAE